MKHVGKSTADELLVKTKNYGAVTGTRCGQRASDITGLKETRDAEINLAGMDPKIIYDFFLPVWDNGRFFIAYKM